MWKGTQSKLTVEDTSKGINGVASISDIPDGYLLEAYNVDLSEPGRVKKRSGYQTYGCRLPVRTKYVETNGVDNPTLNTLDYVKLRGVTLKCYLNTGANATLLTNSENYFPVDDRTNTIMVKIDWPGFVAGVTVVPAITTETLFELVFSVSLSKVYKPLRVYDDGVISGQAVFLLPDTLRYWFTIVPTLTDNAATNITASLCEGYSFNRLDVSQVTAMTLATGTFGKEITLTYPATSPLGQTPVATFVTFESGVAYAAPNRQLGVNGCVSSVTSTSMVIALTGTLLTANGSLPLTNLSILYSTVKHLAYLTQTANVGFFAYSINYNVTSFAPFLKLLDCVNIYTDTFVSAIDASLVTTTSQEIGFLYGLDVDVGYVNCLNKYFDSSEQKERMLVGYSGSFFVEREIEDSPKFLTVASLPYIGASTTFTASAGKFTIPVTNANEVYSPGDIVTFSYATDWKGTQTTASYLVSSATNASLILSAGTDVRLYVPRYTYFKLTRTSERVYLKRDPTPALYFNEMVLQYGEANPLQPNYVAKVVNYFPTTGSPAFNYLELDTEITWSSDEYLTPNPIFYPIFLSGLNAPINTNYDIHDVVDYNSVELERSVVIAARENGMWRYNGNELLNMRIPRPPSGFIRNVRGTNGFLKIDRGTDGLQTGRIYDFIVTYSYTELVNGKLVTYESGLSPVGAYVITSAPALDGSGDSQLVELSIPTVPLGIGLPAEAMTINVYRTLSGRLATQPTSEIYLLERSVVNNPHIRYQQVLAGTESPFLFNESNYRLLYASVQNDVVNDELAREIIDPPLASVVATLENRIIAGNGGEQPYTNLICNEVYDQATSDYSAYGQIGVSKADENTPFSFVLATMTPASTVATGKTTPVGATTTYQIFSALNYDLSTIAYTDNSHLFRAALATTAVGVKYLLRFAAGRKEAFEPGKRDSYYDGFAFESQTFTGTSVATELEAQRKWVSKDAAGTVITPTETFLVFAESQKIETIASDNGLRITGISGEELTATDTSAFTLYVKGSSITYVAGNYLILKGLGTTGLVKDENGDPLDFDKDIVCEVGNLTGLAAGTYPLFLCKITNDAAGATLYKRVTVKSAVSVSNTASGVTHPPFTIFLLQSATARSLTNFSLPAATATLTITTAPALTIPAGTDIIVDGLFDDIPKGSGADWNRKYKATNYAAGVFTVTAPKLPEGVRGSIGHTLGAGSYGKLSVPKDIFSTVDVSGYTYLRVELNLTAISYDIQDGLWVYLIVRGREDDSYFSPLTGWFKIKRWKSAVGGAWSTGLLPSGSNLKAVELDLNSPAGTFTLDFSTLVGVSETKLVMPRSLNTVIVPVPTKQTTTPYNSDITGTMYGPSDGYTPLEKVIRRLAHAINMSRGDTCYAYWGGKRIANDETSSPSNVLPTNGLKIIPHLYPTNRQAFRYSSVVTSYAGEFESGWNLWSNDELRIEASERSEGVGFTGFGVATSYAKEVRPSRVWYSNPTGTLIGQAFRELSYDEIDSQDGESIRAISPMQTFGLLFKKSSTWRISFNNGAVLVKDRTPSVVGASSAKNVIPTPKGAFFLHDSGLYFTDGGTVEDVLQPSRIFRDRVSQNVDLFNFTSGFHNPFTKTVYVGIPLSPDKTQTVSYIDGQFVFNYSNKSITLYSIDTGWSVNTQLPATYWVRRDADAYFSSTDGFVYRMRREKTKTAYSDKRAAIPFKIRTRYIDAQDPVGVRMYRSIFFQFGTETTNTMNIGFAYDFQYDYTHISAFAINTSELANAIGTVALSDKLVEAVRRTPPNPRSSNISLEITNEEVDTAAEVHGIFLDSMDGSTKLVSQPGT